MTREKHDDAQLRRELHEEIASLTDDELGLLISMMEFLLETREAEK